MMPLPVTPKRSTQASVTCRSASTTLMPGLPSVASRPMLAARPSGSIAMALSIRSGTNEAYAIRQVGLNRSKNLSLRGTEPTAVPVDHGLGNVTNLDVAVLRESDQQ